MTELRSEVVVRAFGLGVNEAAVCSHVMDHFDVDCFLLAGRFTLLEQGLLAWDDRRAVRIHDSEAPASSIW
jgi:D-threo-aldose 1-dehydrogenase